MRCAICSVVYTLVSRVFVHESIERQKLQKKKPVWRANVTMHTRIRGGNNNWINKSLRLFGIFSRYAGIVTNGFDRCIPNTRYILYVYLCRNAFSRTVRNIRNNKTNSNFRENYLRSEDRLSTIYTYRSSVYHYAYTVVVIARHGPDAQTRI